MVQVRPPQPISYADVAQSAERILGKDKVTSSILVISSIYKQGFLCEREAFLLSWAGGLLGKGSVDA